MYLGDTWPGWDINYESAAGPGSISGNIQLTNTKHQSQQFELSFQIQIWGKEEPNKMKHHICINL